MVITFTALLTAMLLLFRPLQKNAFFILYFGLMVGAAYYVETFYFRTAPFSYRSFLLFVPFHVIFINLVTIFAYGVDKKAAVSGKWRVSEARLHTLEFLGGWPGAFLAQKVFRHKTKKKGYQAMFWLMLFLQGALVWYILKLLHIIR